MFLTPFRQKLDTLMSACAVRPRVNVLLASRNFLENAMSQLNFKVLLVVLCIFSGTSAIQSQDKEIFSKVKNDVNAAQNYASLADTNRITNNFSKGCVNLILATSHWDHAIANFKNFVVSFPTGPKERQAATLKEFERRRNESATAKDAMCEKARVAGDAKR